MNPIAYNLRTFPYRNIFSFPSGLLHFTIFDDEQKLCLLQFALNQAIVNAILFSGKFK